MENASKALIIAGAILLSIAIIGIGMTVFNNVSPLVTDTGMDKYEIEKFNNQFKSYEGVKKGNNVQALIDTVNANNRTNSADASKCVQITSKTDAALLPAGVTASQVASLSPGTKITGGDKWTSGSLNGREVQTYNKSLIKSGKNYVVAFVYDESGTGIITEINIALKTN